MKQTAGSTSQKNKLKKWQDELNKLSMALVAVLAAANNGNLADFENKMNAFNAQRNPTTKAAKKYGFKVCWQLSSAD